MVLVVVIVKYVPDWPDAATNCFEVVSAWSSERVPLLMKSASLSKLEADSEILITRPF